MIADILFGLGFVALIEGLVLALAPSHLKRALLLLAAMPPDRLRNIAVVLVAIGVGLIWLARL